MVPSYRAPSGIVGKTKPHWRTTLRQAMYLCNASLDISENGRVLINFTDCSKVVYDFGNTNATNTSSVTQVQDDAFGAMQYTVAVVFVYGVAVLGVFGLGHLSRQKHRNNNDDKQTDEFLKNYDEVRRVWEQRSRVGAVSQLLHNLHNEPVGINEGPGRKMSRKSRPSVNSLAFLPISLSKISEPGGAECDDNSTSVTNENELGSSVESGGRKNNVVKEPKVTSLLGKSRRAYNQCNQCWITQGVGTDVKECRCARPKTSRSKSWDNGKSRRMSCQDRRAQFKNTRVELHRFLDKKHEDVIVV